MSSDVNKKLAVINSVVADLGPMSFSSFLKVIQVADEKGNLSSMEFSEYFSTENWWRLCQNMMKLDLLVRTKDAHHTSARPAQIYRLSTKGKRLRTKVLNALG